MRAPFKLADALRRFAMPLPRVGRRMGGMTDGLLEIRIELATRTVKKFQGWDYAHIFQLMADRRERLARGDALPILTAKQQMVRAFHAIPLQDIEL